MDFKLNKLFLAIAIVFAVVYGVLGEALYRIVSPLTTRVPSICAYIFTYAVLFALILIFRGITKRRYVKIGSLVKTVLIFSLCFLVIVPSFEFIYELGNGSIKVGTHSKIQYVFLIDDSSSMDSNDPSGERYTAVEKIINGMDNTDAFAVYRFARKWACVTELGSENSDTYRLELKNLGIGGTTNLMTALNDITKELETNGVNTKIIVLTDGSPTDNLTFTYNSTIKNCVENNVSVSSVGFGQPNEIFLQRLADSTGGVYVHSDSVDMLQNSLTTVVDAIVSSASSNRDLLGYRLDATEHNILYILMRIVFLAAFGIVWTMIKTALIGETLHADKISKIMAVIACVAAVLTEVLLLLGVADMLVRIIFCIMWSIVLIPKQDSLEYSSAGVNKDFVYYN